MRSTGLTLTICLAALTAAFVMIAIGPPSDGATIVVPDDYASIQDAIDNANAGDTIRIHAGTYTESVLVNKTVHIVGNGTTNTTIVATGIQTIEVSSPNVNVSGLNVTGATMGSGIYLNRIAGCTVKDVHTRGNSYGFFIYRSSDDTIHNCTSTGNSAAGIGVFENSKNITFSHCRADGNSGYGFTSDERPSGIDIDNCSFDNNVNAGVHFFKTTFVRLVDSTMNRNTQLGVYLEQPRHVRLVRCTVSYQTTSHGIFFKGNEYNITLDSCRITHNTGSGLYAQGSQVSSMVNCSILNNSAWGIRWDGVTRFNMSGCKVEGNAYRPMSMSNSNHCSITNSTFKGVGGIGLGASHNNTISGCTINSTSATEAAILMEDGSDDCTITQCVLYAALNAIATNYANDTVVDWCDVKCDFIAFALNYCDRFVVSNSTVYGLNRGINTANCDDMIIRDNVVEGYFTIQMTQSDRMRLISNRLLAKGGVSSDTVLLNGVDDSIISANHMRPTRAGVYLTGCINNMVSGNYIGPTVYGVLIGGMSQHNTIKENWMQGCRYGFYISGPLNEVYHNNFIANKTWGQMAYSNPGNTHDAGYPIGGNYWSDYTGPDLLSGASQDLPGPDGIGDVPYPVAGPSGPDRYPLASPYGNTFMPNITGEVLVTSHKDGDVVSGRVVVEAVCTIDYVHGIRFYVDGVEVATDPTGPYQYILDTSTLVEDSTIELRAEALPRYSGVKVDHTISLVVNNQVQTGAWLSVATARAEYHPDQMVSGRVGLSSPPAAGAIRLVATYNGTGDEPVSVMDTLLPVQTGYGVTFWLPSDATNGTYRLDARAYGVSGGSVLWESTASSTFQVTGSGKYEQLESLLQNLTALYNDNSAKLSAILSDLAQVEVNLSGKVDGMNASVRADLSQALTQLMGRLDSLDTSMSDLVGRMWADMNATSDADLQRTLAAMTAMWSGINGTAQAGFDQLMASLGLTEDNITTELGLLQSYLDGEIDLSEAEVRAKVSALWDDLNGTYVALDRSIATALVDLEVNMSDDSDALRDYIALRSAQLELYLDLANASLHLHMDAIEDALDAYRDEVRGDLSGVAAYLEGMEANATTRSDDVLLALEVLDELVTDVNEASLAKTRDMLGDLEEALVALNTTEGDRHAATVSDLIGELDEVEDGLEARIDATDESLAALEKLDTILTELEQVDEGIETTQEDVGEGDAGLRSIIFILLVLLLVNIVLVALMFLRMRGAEARMRELEPVVHDESDGN